MASSRTKNLARQILDLEAAHGDVRSGARRDIETLSKTPDELREASGIVAVHVIEKLCARMIKLAGVQGFQTLLSRALTMAKAEAPSLSTVHVRPDGTLEGFDGMASCEEPEVQKQAGTVLVAHLLELLVTFIGEPLTLHILHDVWPDASSNGADLTIIEEQS